MAMLVPDPDMSALVYCLSDVLLQGCICRWYQLDVAFTLQTVCGMPCCGACSVVKQYDEPLSGVHGIFINMIRCSGEKTECLVSSVELSTQPTLYSIHIRRSRRPCRSPSNHQTSVVPALSQGPEPEQSRGLPRCGKTSPY